MSASADIDNLKKAAPSLILAELLDAAALLERSTLMLPTRGRKPALIRADLVECEADIVHRVACHTRDTFDDSKSVRRIHHSDIALITALVLNAVAETGRVEVEEVAA